ncbi:Plasmodium exported protein (hyp10), unknown function [Plasmodium sp. gorilla clade G2]|uniref:Plasmodium exported protein (hyp10), unknown function n=1 Tax=Plasmodium sp. gorilla clade G2 TaxID=880535 RepID=UPI000D223B4A|nr:Plasmodium exported protein (hyp10), unknown function [Plasmodium sp. gorilla clade G2]SOV11998.1 Plasmodium exported protein (hyp10), unknown function [Plasmodium sp. gorilla clade G2]
MSCNYFKLFMFSILLCILIITHKFSPENVRYNKKNTDGAINIGYKRLLAEAQETDIFKNHSGENSLTYPTYNKLDENDMRYPKTSSDCTLNNEILEEHRNQTEQVELKNKKNNKSLFQKSQKKKNYTKKIIIGLIVFFFLFQ